jgi:hypothetical protein
LQLFRVFILQAGFVMNLENYVTQSIAESALRIVTHCFVILQRCVVGCWTIRQGNILEGSGQRLSYM